MSCFGRLFSLALVGGLLTVTSAEAQTPAAAPRTVAAAPAASAVSNADYVLAAGDVVRITVFQSPELTLETRLSDSGVVSYPLLGSLRLAGRSVAQTERLIADGLVSGGFLRQPQVSVQITQVRGNQVSVLGVVPRPGRFPLDQTGMRMSDLLAQAGGVAPGGSEVVTLTGVRDGKPYRAQVDVAMLFTRGGVNDPVLINGDVIYVDRMPIIYIYGEVQRPGQIRLERDMSVMQALAAGGGLTGRGTERGIRVHRRDASGTEQVMETSLRDRLQEGDVIYVRESLF
jgi:polysaccharide biosynthesis/export protein